MDKIIEMAEEYLKRIPSSVEIEGTHYVLNMINTTNSVEQQRDYLMSFLLASLYGKIVKRIVFEESCSKHPSKGPHDLVVYLDRGTRIVNEIRRLKQTRWDKYEEENHVSGSIKKTGQLYELRDDPDRSTTGFLDTILKEIEAKGTQLDSEEINIIWIASKGMHYKATDIEDAASYYSVGCQNISNIHIMPKDLTALGWFWDGDPFDTTAEAECFFIKPTKVIDKLKNIFLLKTFNNK
ncbi:MAG: hypothetical protein IPH11_11180 [Ignavibacteriales bacterium]|nr:hypothetical protein [Ignavibacteriales bacterium]